MEVAQGRETREQQHARRREVLAGLRESFVRFRAGRRRGTRVPETLRLAVLAALDVGVALADIRRMCAVTEAQVDRWRAQQEGAPVGPEPAVRRDVREFQVVADPSAAPEGCEGPELELRLGPWRVSVRLSAAGEG